MLLDDLYLRRLERQWLDIQSAAVLLADEQTAGHDLAPAVAFLGSCLAAYSASVEDTPTAVVALHLASVRGV